ncbi:MAG: 4Fe-4S dicluster domain-containing protein [Chloroflexi bacterium]|nr:4Fe-4S dicluster domain-containing protein [Chloroflexota bacterium]
MKLSTMWKEALGSLVQRPATEKYPFVRQEAPEHLRSKLHWDLEGCTGCSLCAKDCPANAIEIITIDKKAKRFVFHYYVDRCTFCGQCVASCNKDCIELVNNEWELAALDKDNFELYYGNDADVDSVLAEPAEADVEEPITA